MKILVLADIHGDTGTLRKVIEKAESHNPDVVVCPGNVTDIFKTPPEFSQLDVADLVVQQLLSLRKPVLCIPGNHDPPEILEVFNDYGVNIHAKHTAIHGTHFVGFGGAPTPFNTPFEPTEEETADALASLPTHSPTIAVIHNPPHNTKLDAIGAGKHVGSPAVRSYILSKKPHLVLTAHIHESRGKDTLGPTTIVNPGPVFNKHYALVDVTKKSCVVTLKTL